MQDKWYLHHATHMATPLYMTHLAPPSYDMYKVPPSCDLFRVHSSCNTESRHLRHLTYWWFKRLRFLCIVQWPCAVSCFVSFVYLLSIFQSAFQHVEGESPPVYYRCGATSTPAVDDM